MLDGALKERLETELMLRDMSIALGRRGPGNKGMGVTYGVRLTQWYKGDACLYLDWAFHCKAEASGFAEALLLALTSTPKACGF